jgi:single-strand DNA-binding protein
VNVNKAIIVGNLTRNPELRYTQNGANFTTFGVATNRAWRNETGELQEEVDFHNIVVFGDTAQNAAEYLVKGQLVYIEGRIRTRAWGESEGRKLYRTDIVAERIQFGPKPQPRGTDEETDDASVDAAGTSVAPLSEDQSDGIPF